MERISGAGNLNGMFVREDLTLSPPRPPTELTDSWFNSVQEEIVSVAMATGAPLNPGDRGQMLSAINQLINSAKYSEKTVAIDFTAGNVGLSGTQLSATIIEATGSPVSACTLVVPNTESKFVFDIGSLSQQVTICTPAPIVKSVTIKPKTPAVSIYSTGSGEIGLVGVDYYDNRFVQVGAKMTTFGSTPLPGTLAADGAAYGRVAYADLYKVLVIDPGFTAQTFSVSISNPAVVTKAAHGFSGGERLRLFTTGILATGLNSTTDYFVEKIDANTFYLSTNPVIGGGGSRIITTGTQSGVHSFLRSLYGLGDGSTTFNVPDFRGETLRGFDAGRGVDAGRVIGTIQNGMSQINPGVLIKSSTFGIADGTYDWNTGSAIVGAFDFSAAPYGTTATAYPETRSRNMSLLVCIKY